MFGIMFFAVTGVFVAAAATEDNLIKNGNFSAGLQGWWLVQNEGGSANLSPENGILGVNVTNPGRRPTSLLVGYSHIGLEKNQVYQISFKARSQEIGKIQIATKMEDAPYYGYSGSHCFALAEEFHQYSFSFTMRQATDSHAVLLIFLGRMGKGRIEMTDFRLTKIGPKETGTIPKNFPQPFATRIMRGITFGNTLDAHHEGDWSPELREEYFDLIKSRGIYDHIRIPVRWDNHAQPAAPFTIEPEFMDRVDWAVSQGLKRGFYVVLNMHYFDELVVNPKANEQELIALWRQIAERFRDYPENLYFEIYNEPQKELSSNWNRIYPKVYDVIRETNPTRTIVISGPGWANVSALKQLVLPKQIKEDPNVIVQFHFYYPNEFCFQGAIGNGFDDIQGYRWKGSDSQKKELARMADTVADWAKRNGGVRLWNGEFCAHSDRSVEEDRLKWTAYIIKLCEERDIAWAYWNFAGDSSGIYDIDAGKWDEPLLNVMKND
jgi:endoglucanase